MSEWRKMARPPFDACQVADHQCKKCMVETVPVGAELIRERDAEVELARLREDAARRLAVIVETGWVIVRDLPGDLGYFNGAAFSTVSLDAIRYARLADAVRTLKLLHGGAYHEDRVEEHQWTGNVAG